MTDDVQDLRDTIVPKSDQLNADDLLTGPMTAKIVRVSRGNAEQPVVVHLDGHRPWKPCKGMRRVLIAAWTNDGRAWAGKSVTLYRNPEVTYGGVKIGGIEVSHLSDIPERMTIALTVTRGRKRLHTVEPLRVERATAQAPQPSRDLSALLEESLRGMLKEAMQRRDVQARNLGEVRKWLTGLSDGEFSAVCDEVLPPLREPGDETEPL